MFPGPVILTNVSASAPQAADLQKSVKQKNRFSATGNIDKPATEKSVSDKSRAENKPQTIRRIGVGSP